MKKRLLAALLSAAMAVTLLAGCSTPNPATEVPTEKAEKKYSTTQREQSQHLWTHRKETVSRIMNCSMQ